MEVNMQVIKDKYTNFLCPRSDAEGFFRIRIRPGQKFRIHSIALKYFKSTNTIWRLRIIFQTRRGSLAFGSIDVFLNLYGTLYVNCSDRVFQILSLYRLLEVGIMLFYTAHFTRRVVRYCWFWCWGSGIAFFWASRIRILPFFEIMLAK